MNIEKVQPKEGMKFVVRSHPTPIYTIAKIKNDICKITWNGGNGSSNYPLLNVEDYLTDHTWILQHS